MTGEMLRQYGHGTWIVIEGSEVVGLCGYKKPPDNNGTVSIGYGIAASRRGRGLATGAVSGLLRCAAMEPLIRFITAETSIDNPASQRVLAKNGFKPAGTRIDQEDGELIVWRRAIP
jgi:RimJ/RimL family protein N-acetyltransferase